MMIRNVPEFHWLPLTVIGWHRMPSGAVRSPSMLMCSHRLAFVLLADLCLCSNETSFRIQPWHCLIACPLRTFSAPLSS